MIESVYAISLMLFLVGWEFCDISHKYEMRPPYLTIPFKIEAKKYVVALLIIFQLKEAFLVFIAFFAYFMAIKYAAENKERTVFKFASYYVIDFVLYAAIYELFSVLNYLDIKHGILGLLIRPFI